MKGKGVYKVNSNFRGEHHVRIVVDVPSVHNDSQRQAVELMREAYEGSQEHYTERKQDSKKKGFKKFF